MRHSSLKSVVRHQCQTTLGALKYSGNQLVRSLDRFFFNFSVPVTLALFRWTFGITLLINVCLRMFQTEYYFTDLGGVPWDGALNLVPEFFRPSVELYPKNLSAVWSVQIVLVLALITSTIGAFGRIGSRIAWIVVYGCHLSLLQRNYSIVYGADMVTSFWLFGLCFTDSSERLSLRSYLARKRRGFTKSTLQFEPVWSRMLTSVGIRLIQIQLCIIYVYTGFEKLKGGDWWDQTAVWKVLGNEQLMLMDLSFLRNVPLAIGIATWGTVLFEIYGPFFFWQRTTRKWSLMAGWLLHIGIAATMGLYIFSLTMMSAYFLFIDNRWIDSRFSSWFAPRSS